MSKKKDMERAKTGLVYRNGGPVRVEDIKKEASNGTERVNPGLSKQ